MSTHSNIYLRLKEETKGTTMSFRLRMSMCRKTQSLCAFTTIGMGM